MVKKIELQGYEFKIDNGFDEWSEEDTGQECDGCEEYLQKGYACLSSWRRCGMHEFNKQLKETLLFSELERAIMRSDPHKWSCKRKQDQEDHFMTRKYEYHAELADWSIRMNIDALYTGMFYTEYVWRLWARTKCSSKDEPTELICHLRSIGEPKSREDNRLGYLIYSMSQKIHVTQRTA